MASSHQEMREQMQQRARRRRWILLIVLGFTTIAWGPRTVELIVNSWSTASHVLEHERELKATHARQKALQREVAYARTVEGRDVQAKRQFGVGPRDEIWITLEAEEPEPQPTGPLSIGQQVHGWLMDAGSRFLDHCRNTASLLRYWVGLDPAPDIPSSTGDNGDTTEESSAEDMAADEAGSDEEDVGQD
ncbi:MAG: hypothetical protein U9R79_05720 [Armatimonadota bacterium]|nr:hypothetical protein [Armatimonadota bacterium]